MTPLTTINYSNTIIYCIFIVVKSIEHDTRQTLHRPRPFPTKLDEISITDPLLRVEDLFHEYSIGEIRLWLAGLNEAALRQEGTYDNAENRNDLFCFTHTLIRGLEAMYLYTTIKNKP